MYIFMQKQTHKHTYMHAYMTYSVPVCDRVLPSVLHVHMARTCSPARGADDVCMRAHARGVAGDGLRAVGGVGQHSRGADEQQSGRAHPVRPLHATIPLSFVCDTSDQCM